jgi:RNA polymerase sigma factor (sigma-70 family)
VSKKSRQLSWSSRSFNRLRRLCREAQEVVQETVIAVAKKIHKFKTDPAFGTFKAWLLHLTRWRIADQLRKRQRQARAHQHRSDRSSTTTTTGMIQDPAGFELEHIWDEEWEKNLIDAAIEKDAVRIRITKGNTLREARIFQ